MLGRKYIKLFNLKLTIMKTIRKSKEKNATKGVITLKVKDLMQIRGGEIDGSTQKNSVL